MRRFLNGITALALFAGCVASVSAEARGWRAHGYHGLHGYSIVQPGYRYGYGASTYQDADWDGYGAGSWLAPIAAASVLLPLAAAAQSGYSYASLGDYCATPARTCLLYSAAPVDTGCSCKVPGGRMRGTVE